MRVRAVNANGNGAWSYDWVAEVQYATVTIALAGPMVISEPAFTEEEVHFILTHVQRTRGVQRAGDSGLPQPARRGDQGDERCGAHGVAGERQQRRVGGDGGAVVTCEAVTVRISGGGDSCGTGDAVCTEDGRRLSNSPSVSVEGSPAVPLAAELDGVPGAHDGERTFTLRLTSSEGPDAKLLVMKSRALGSTS